MTEPQIEKKQGKQVCICIPKAYLATNKASKRNFTHQFLEKMVPFSQHEKFRTQKTKNGEPATHCLVLHVQNTTITQKSAL
jgi:hypothetical protein